MPRLVGVGGISDISKKLADLLFRRIIVTRDIPANTVAVGNPCRVMCEISERDKEYYFRDMKVDYPYTLRLE